MRNNIYSRHVVFGYPEWKFLRAFGLHKIDFLYLPALVTDWLQEKSNNPKSGHPFVLTPYGYLVITLPYMRQCHAMDSPADGCGVAKSTIRKAYNRAIAYLVASGKLRLMSKSDLSEGDVTVADATESPIDRPKKGQKKYCSGKKKRHTMKTRILFCKSKGLIVGACFDKGHVHGFGIFKEPGAGHISEEAKFIGDSGYQGMDKCRKNREAPCKKPRGGELAKGQKASNLNLSKERICIEHVNAWAKRFRILKDRCRNKRCNFWKPMYFACVVFNWNQPSMQCSGCKL